MIAVPPFRAELGILIRFHACAVRALPRPVTVAIEPGLEALYPDCDHVIVEPRPDVDRRWTYRHDAAFLDVWRQHFAEYEIVEPDKENRLTIRAFLPEPHEPQRGDSDPGIVVCPRLRNYGSEKNWPTWPLLARGLRKEGFRVFAAGLRETSYRVDSDENAWDYARPLDATIEAMRSAQLVVSTASGLSLLAVLCGVPLLLVASSGGKVAPGPSRDLDGRVHHDRYWQVPIGDYYRPLNHTHSAIEMDADGWETPRRVLDRAMEMAS